MRRVIQIAFACCLVWLAVACSRDKGGDSAGSDVEVAVPGPTCEQQVASFGSYLAELRRAKQAIEADPLAAHKGSAMSSDTAVSIDEPAKELSVIAPVPDAFTIEVTNERFVVDGQPSEPYADRLDDAIRSLTRRLDDVVCPSASPATKPRDIALIARPGAPWRAVQRAIRAADAAGAPRILLAFSGPSGVESPAQAALAQASGLDPAAVFAACPAVAAALGSPTAADAADTADAADEADAADAALLSALAQCECNADFAQLPAVVYARSGLVERGGQIPLAIALSFIDPDAQPGGQRAVISAASDAPWSSAHGRVLASLGAGGAFITGEDGVEVDESLRVAQAERGAAHCTTLAAAREARRAYDDRIARNAGILGQIGAMQGGAFASLTGTGDFSSGLDDANIYGGLLGDEVGEMQGGFGLGKSGYGPGGGGTGWGTIGTGSYGTIGHGSGIGSGYGTGSGRGGMGKRSEDYPQVRIGNATVSGPLDKDIIRRYIRRKLPRIKYCYEKRLLIKPGIEGEVTASFQITKQGAVGGAKASGVDSEVASCIAGVIETIQFPRPKGDVVNVSYPFTFKPTGG